jgi:colanic acid/amylovoran biosynthesis glycosyltransferase
MRVLIFSDNFGGNTTTFIYNEVLGLKADFEIKYLCIERENEKLFPFGNVVQVPYTVHRLVKKWRWWLEIYDIRLVFKNHSFAKSINQIVDEFKPDLIHCHFGYEALRFFDNLSVKYHGIPSLISFRGYDASQFLNRKAYIRKIKNLVSRRNVHCTFVCDFLRRNLIASGIPVGRYIILHSGTKLDFFMPKSVARNKDEFVFLQISGFQPYKGHEYTLKAFKKIISKVPDVKLKLILAGGGPLIDHVKNLVEQLGLMEFVEFTGWVNHDQAIDLLNRADVFVQHSVTVNGITEGIPNSLMEAMAMQLPVISTKHAGIPELVEDGVHGFLVAEKDIETYSEKMIEIMSWPSRLERNRTKIEAEFEFLLHMKKLINYYQEILIKSAKC